LRRSSPLFYDNFLIRMILVIIRMKVLSEKCMELSQTIASLSGSIRMEKGCRRCDFCQSIEDENQLFFNLL
jgi:quinol monooxygenase YgiN